MPNEPLMVFDKNLALESGGSGGSPMILGGQSSGGEPEAYLMRTDDPADAYLPLKALTRYSGLSVRTLRGYLTDPIRPLPYYRVGGKLLVRRSEFDAWVQGFRAEARASLDHIVDDVIDGVR